VVSICDVYCALTSANRPYKQPWTHNQALGYIGSEAGRQFCPALTKTFLALMADNAVLRKTAA
jgi:putative two-component system response regulator